MCQPTKYRGWSNNQRYYLSFFNSLSNSGWLSCQSLVHTRLFMQTTYNVSFCFWRRCFSNVCSQIMHGESVPFAMFTFYPTVVPFLDPILKSGSWVVQRVCEHTESGLNKASDSPARVAKCHIFYTEQIFQTRFYPMNYNLRPYNIFTQIYLPYL